MEKRIHILHRYMRQLYQMIDYINWMTMSYTKSNFFSVCYNIIISYVQIYHRLTFSRWDDDGETVSGVS